MTNPSFLRAVAVALGLAAPSLFGAFQTGQSSNLALGDQRVAANSFSSPRAVAVDPSTGKLFVADDLNHRVLRFSSPAAFSNGATAEAAFGQPDLDTQTSGTSQSKMNRPSGVWVDAGGRLWVADSSNNRVLRFDAASTASSGANAAVVLGQANFTSSTASTTQSSMSNPFAVLVDDGGRLWVADRNNNRVLRFSNAASKTNGGPADGVLGQSAYSSNTAATTQAGLSQPCALAMHGAGTGPNPYTLFIAEAGNRRVVRHDAPEGKANGALANGVLGQSDYTTVVASDASNKMTTPNGMAVTSSGHLFVSDLSVHRVLRFNSARAKTNGASADGVLGQAGYGTSGFGAGSAEMRSPAGLALDGSGTLWLADTNNNRVTRFDNAVATANGASADGILGHAGFTDPAAVDAAHLSGPRGVAEDPATGKVFVADTANNRVLRFSSQAALHNGQSAEAVLGQPDFTSSTGGTTAALMKEPTGLSVDAGGRLWVADRGNARVLRFDNAASKVNGANADGVLGQPDFTTVNSGVSGLVLGSPSAVCADSSGALWVADSVYNRCVRWDAAASKANGAAMNGVLGQGGFTFSGSGTTANTFTTPLGVVSDGAGHVWVADAQNNRVMRFNLPATSASAIYGQAGANTNVTGNAADRMNLPVGVRLDMRGTLWVVDSNNSRVLWFRNAASSVIGVSADGVLGQEAFGSNVIGNSPARLRLPWAVAPAGRRTVWVADSGNNRVLRFSSISAGVVGYGLNGSNHFFFTFESAGGHDYEVETSTDLLNWTLHSTVTATGTTHTFTDNATAGGRKFYRATEP